MSIYSLFSSWDLTLKPWWIPTNPRRDSTGRRGHDPNRLPADHKDELWSSSTGQHWGQSVKFGHAAGTRPGAVFHWRCKHYYFLFSLHSVINNGLVKPYLVFRILAWFSNCWRGSTFPHYSSSFFWKVARVGTHIRVYFLVSCALTQKLQQYSPSKPNWEDCNWSVFILLHMPIAVFAPDWLTAVRNCRESFSGWKAHILTGREIVCVDVIMAPWRFKIYMETQKNVHRNV